MHLLFSFSALNKKYTSCLHISIFWCLNGDDFEDLLHRKDICAQHNYALQQVLFPKTTRKKSLIHNF